LRDPTCQVPLVAIHSALLTGGEGGATPLILEELKQVEEIMDRLIEFPAKPLTDEIVEFQVEGSPSEHWKCEVQNFGKTTLRGESLSTFNPNQSAIRRWLQHNEWCDDNLVSRKGIMEGVPLLVKNAQKGDVGRKGISFGHFRKCVTFFSDKFKHCKASVFSDDEAINGRFPMTPLNMKTSCGYIAKYFHNGKSELFDRDSEEGEPAHYILSHIARNKILPVYGVSFYERLEDVEQKLRLGVVPFMLWVAKLKDEVRPREKVEKGKTRVFEMPPLEHTILCRKYFGDFINWMKEQDPFVSHCGVGRDKVSVWAYYYEQLSSTGGMGFDIDYSSFDGSNTGLMFSFFQQVTDAFYRSEDDDEVRARHGLLECIKRAYLIVGDDLVRTEQGNKSGCAMTDILNSVNNVFVLLLAYLHGRMRAGFSGDFRDFDRDIRMITYGDDVIVGADLNTLHYFNRLTVKEVADHIGLKVTSASKSGEFVAYESLKDLTFLKSGFENRDGCVFPIYGDSVIHKQLCWTRKDNLNDTRVQRDIVQGALEFAAHRGVASLRTLERQLRECGRKDTLDYALFLGETKRKQEECLSYVSCSSDNEEYIE